MRATSLWAEEGTTTMTMPALAQGLTHIRSHQSQVGKAFRATFVAFQVDAAAGFQRGHVLGVAVEERHLEAHQGQVGCHGFAAMTGADNGVVLGWLH